MSQSSRFGVGAIAVTAFVVPQIHLWSAPLALPLLAAVGLWALHVRRVDLARRPDAVELALGCWLATWALAIAFGLAPQHSLALSTPTLAFALLFVLLRRGVDAAESWRAVVLCLHAYATLAALTLLWRAMATTGPVAAGGPWAPWVVVPNDLAWGACLWPAVWRALPQAGIGRGAVSIAAALQLAAAAAVGSRLTLVCAALAIAAVVLSPARTPRWRNAALFALAVVVVVLATVVAIKGPASIGARFELWHAAARIALADPIVGVGPHNFVLAYAPHMPAGGAIDPRLTPWPHNLALELWAETGLLGILAAGLLVHSTRGAWWRRTGLVSRGVEFIAWGCFAMLEASTLRTSFWVLLALALARARPSPAAERPTWHGDAGA